MTATIIDFPVPANDPGMRIVDERYTSERSPAENEAYERHKAAHDRFLATPCQQTMDAKIARYAEMLARMDIGDDAKRRRLIGIQRANCLDFMRRRARELDGGAA